MEPMEITLIILGILAAIALIALIVLTVKFVFVSLKKRVKREEKYTAAVKIKDGVRYTEETAVTDAEGMNITHNEGDFILIRDKTYLVKKNGELLPGVYTVLSVNGNDVNFKLRVGDRVRNYIHGDRIVLGEMQEITAVSSDVILR